VLASGKTIETERTFCEGCAPKIMSETNPRIDNCRAPARPSIGAIGDPAWKLLGFMQRFGFMLCTA